MEGILQLKNSAGNLRIIQEGEERHDTLDCSVSETGGQHQAIRVTGIRKQSRLYSG